MGDTNAFTRRGVARAQIVYIRVSTENARHYRTFYVRWRWKAFRLIAPATSSRRTKRRWFTSGYRVKTPGKRRAGDRTSRARATRFLNAATVGFTIIIIIISPRRLFRSTTFVIFRTAGGRRGPSAKIKQTENGPTPKRIFTYTTVCLTHMYAICIYVCGCVRV